MTAPAKPVGLALSGPQIAALIADRQLTSDLGRAPISFAVAGIDRIDLSAPDGATVDSTIAITTLSARTPSLGWLAAAAIHRDHPYNLARRVASVDHLTHGRTGLLLGLSDRYAPAGPQGEEVWGGAALSRGAPVAIETTADAARAIQKLWQSWPAESIVFDKSARVYAHADQIVHIDHHGIFDIAGPLTVPTTPQGAPVLAWRATTIAEAAAAGVAAELVVWPVDALGELDPIPAPFGSAPLFAEMRLDSASEPERLLADLVGDDRLAGIVLRSEASPRGLAQLLAHTLPAFQAAGLIGGPRSGTLRARLGLAGPRPLPAGARAAFPAPTPHDDDQANSKWW